METLVEFGGEVKALGDGRVGGYLVRFGDAKKTDLTGDFFSNLTDFATQFPAKSLVYYNHALDADLKSRVLGQGDMKIDDVGVWIEAQLEMRDAYEKAVYGFAEKGKLGWSSGTASHLVERKQHGDVWEITRWPLGLDASLTPTPAEKRTRAVTLKSLMDLEVKTEKETRPRLAASISSIREFEEQLRELGYSQSEAVAIASHGYKARTMPRDSEADRVQQQRAARLRLIETRLQIGWTL